MIPRPFLTSIGKKAALDGLRDAREGKKKGAKMARTYTIGEAAKILAEGTDVEAVTDIHKRFPMTAQKVLEAFAGGKDAVAEMMGYIPDFITTRKVEKQIVSGGSAEDDAEDVAEDAAEPDAVEDKPAPKRRGRKPAKVEDDEAEDEKPAPKKRGRKPAKAKPEPEPDTAEDEDAEDEDEGKYSGMNAMQLFKECKKRGIKAAPKKPAKFYVELLEADDAKADDVDDDSDDDDDWDI